MVSRNENLSKIFGRYHIRVTLYPTILMVLSNIGSA